MNKGSLDTKGSRLILHHQCVLIRAYRVALSSCEPCNALLSLEWGGIRVKRTHIVFVIGVEHGMSFTADQNITIPEKNVRAHASRSRILGKVACVSQN